MLDRHAIVKKLVKKGFLVSPEILQRFEAGDITFDELTKKEFVLQAQNNKKKQKNKQVQILLQFKEKSGKRTVSDFVKHFSNRYEYLCAELRNRPELINSISIKRILQRKSNEFAAFVGLVYAKETTRNKHIILHVEDQTGIIKVIIHKKNEQLIEEARMITPDEVIGITGTNRGNVVYANSIIFPDIPQETEKKAPYKENILFISDLHVGSNKFLENHFKRFIKWIQGKQGNEKQKELAHNTKYIIIAGDLVDGCGIYPNQEKELKIKDIYKQYEFCAELLSQIPEDKTIIACPGNHDAVRLAEPQPPLSKEFTKAFYFKNIIFTSNPSYIRIGEKDNFPGFDILLYHGYSFDYYVANIDPIRLKGGYKKADLIMRALLKKRHLAPTHTSSLYIPNQERDHLLISRIPDFFVTGHIHKACIAQYKSVTMVCGSCWQAKTPFQEKVGHEPEPSRVPIIDLKTRKMKMLNFF